MNNCLGNSLMHKHLGYPSHHLLYYPLTRHLWYKLDPLNFLGGVIQATWRSSFWNRAILAAASRSDCRASVGINEKETKGRRCHCWSRDEEKSMMFHFLWLMMAAFRRLEYTAPVQRFRWNNWFIKYPGNHALWCWMLWFKLIST